VVAAHCKALSQHLKKPRKTSVRVTGYPTDIWTVYSQNIRSESRGLRSRVAHKFGWTMCGYEVPGMILFQAYLYNYSLLRGNHFRSNPLSPLPATMLLAQRSCHFWKQFLQLPQCISFQRRCHIFLMFQYHEILVPWRQVLFFGNGRKTLGAKSGEWGGCSILVISFWARKCLTESALWFEALSWCRIQSLDQISGLFLLTASSNHFNISI